MNKSKVGEFKTGDEVTIVRGSSRANDFFIGFSVGDKFVIDSFDEDGDALNSDERWCKLQCLELLSPPQHKRILWDGKEILEVGMWASSATHEEECQIILITDKEIAYIDSTGEIMTDRIDCLSPIDQRTDKEKLIELFFKESVGVSDEQVYKSLLSWFYDGAIKHKA